MKSNHTKLTGLTSAAKRELLTQLLKRRANGEDNVFPLSFSQQRLWFLDQIEPENPTYNIPAAFRLTGRLQPALLQASINEVVRRHEVLRTTFATSMGKPVQIIAPSLSVELTRVDLQRHARSSREAKALEWMREEIECPFSLAAGPLLRTMLLQLGPEDNVLLVAMHHIITDGWSMGLFARELFESYEARACGASVSLPELPRQYSDFATDQRERLQGQLYEKQLSYWRRKLSGAALILDLPTDYPRSPIQTFAGAREGFALTEQLSESLRKLSREQGATLFMTTLAAFQALLHRYSNLDDIVVGTPIANRNRPGIENLIGFFVNTLVLRTDVSGDPTFLELLGRVRDVALGAYDNQDVPFEKLVEELKPERDLSRSPLFQVLFSLQNAPRQSFELSNLAVETVEVERDIARFDLTLYLWEDGTRLTGALEYNTSLFTSATIRRMTAHLQNVLEGIVCDPGLRLSELPLLTADERRELRVTLNRTTRAYPDDPCFHYLFERQAECVADAVAITFEEQYLTYRELNERANRLAHYLKKGGVGQDVLVGVGLDRSIEMVVALLAIMKAGGAYVPLDPAFPAERLDFMLRDSQTGVLLTQDSLKQNSQLTIRNSGLNVVYLDRDWPAIAGESEENPTPSASADNLAYVIYTSGSTGKPKGVEITHRSLVNFLSSMRHAPGISDQDIHLAVTTLSFDIAALELYLPLTVGARVLIVSSEAASDGRLLARVLEESGSTAMQATPATWQMLFDTGWAGSQHLKALCGGEALPLELARRLLDATASVWNMYGPTETTIWSAVHQLRKDVGAISIGQPIDNTQIYLLDRRFQLVPYGVNGELYIGGDGLARGYGNCPDLTAERFTPDPFCGRAGARLYRTGDLFRRRADGCLEFQGRLDHQVKIRGFRIELQEIEATLELLPDVGQSVVIARDDSSGNKRLVAYFVSPAKRPPRTDELRRFLHDKLPHYMVPSTFIALDAFPLTPNGKVDRKALPDPDGSRPDLASDYVAPQSEVERTIAAVWQEVLAVDRVGVDDNFFDLGGHSLLLVQVQSQLASAAGREFSVIDLFKYPTVRMLAEYSQQSKSEQQPDFIKFQATAEKRQDAIARQKEMVEEVNNNDGQTEYA